VSCRLVNVLIVAPESLPTLIESSLKEDREEAVRYGLLAVGFQYPFCCLSSFQIALVSCEYWVCRIYFLPMLDNQMLVIRVCGE